MRNVGTEAPRFELPGANPDTEDFGEYSLDAAPEDGPVLLNFYMFDFNPACTNHVCTVNEMSWFGVDPDLTVFGISSDRTFSHLEFMNKEHLGFPLLSDSDGSVSEAYGVHYDEFRGHKNIAKRAVFRIDPAGMIQYAWCATEPGEQPDWPAVKEAVEQLKATR